jgi:antitoxin (DNA-binding transcriptional repressor) of toxin-antitoxin stability system
MQLSIREAKARLSEAIVAMERGERVVLTRFGKEIAQLCKPEPETGGFDWTKAERVSKALGLDQAEFAWPDKFDDPAYSREALGLDD